MIRILVKHSNYLVSELQVEENPVKPNLKVQIAHSAPASFLEFQNIIPYLLFYHRDFQYQRLIPVPGGLYSYLDQAMVL